MTEGEKRLREPIKGTQGKRKEKTIKNFIFVDIHNIMQDVEIKLTQNQQKAFNVLLDDYHTAVGYGG